MIDGFGWFEKADFRRAYLMFEEVEYILPRDVAPPLFYPLAVYEATGHRVVHAELSSGALPLIAQQATIDAQRSSMSQLVGSIPRDDVEYARLVVGCDVELEPLLRGKLPDAGWAISFLVNKLVWHAARTGAVPIIGRGYAGSILREKLQTSSSVSRLTSTVPKVHRDYAAFGAGLSLAFISNEKLAALPFAVLEEFKQDNKVLLARQDRHISSIVERYQALGEGAGMEARIASLREDVSREREALETDARLAWRSIKNDVARNAIVTTATSIATGLAVMKGGDTSALLAVGLPALLAGASSAIASSVETLSKLRRAKSHPLAYLFETTKLDPDA